MARRLSQRPWRRLAPKSLAGVLAAVLLAAACADQSSDPMDPDFARVNVSSVTVSPSTASGIVGQSGQFDAVVKDQNGNTITRTVTWSSSDPTIVAVNSTGFATGAGVGSARVVASVGGRSGYSTITVTGVPVAAVSVTPGSASGAVGDSGQFTAAVSDANGNALTGRSVSWLSSNPSVATVSATGMAHAVGGGTANIIATSEGKSGQATVTVAGAPAGPVVAAVSVSPGSASGSVGDSGQFTASVTDALGNVLTGQAVTWTSGNTAVFTVNAAGLARAVGAGAATLSASSGGRTGTATITVTGSAPPPPPPPSTAATLTLSPTTVSLTTAQAQQLVATVKDATGNTMTGQPVTWTSSNPQVATVVGGLVTGLTAGSTTIAAASGVASGSTAVTVTSTVIPPPPPPPPSGSWPNAPSSFPTLTDQPWDVLNTLGWTDIWDHTGAATIPDPTAPFSPSNVLQIVYPTGWVGGSAPATQVFELGSMQRVYVGMWWKPSSPWQGHASNVNKIGFLFDGLGRDMFLGMYGPPGGPYELRVSLELANIGQWLTPNVNNVPITLGQWHRLEWLVDQTTGTVQFWMDGKLIGDYHNIPFVSQLTEFKLSPTWGGMDDAKRETDYYWFDHILVKGY